VYSFLGAGPSGGFVLQILLVKVRTAPSLSKDPKISLDLYRNGLFGDCGVKEAKPLQDSPPFAEKLCAECGLDDAKSAYRLKH